MFELRANECNYITYLRDIQDYICVTQSCITHKKSVGFIWVQVKSKVKIKPSPESIRDGFIKQLKKS